MVTCVPRNGRRATRTPAGRPITSHATYDAAASTPTSTADACRTESAMSGNATADTADPMLLTVLADQYVQKTPAGVVGRWTHSVPIGN